MDDFELLGWPGSPLKFNIATAEQIKLCKGLLLVYTHYTRRMDFIDFVGYRLGPALAVRLLDIGQLGQTMQDIEERFRAQLPRFLKLFIVHQLAVDIRHQSPNPLCLKDR